MVWKELLYRSVIVSLFFMASCTRGELPIEPHASGNVTKAGVDLDPTYKYQVYYDLRTNTVVGRNIKSVWDIGLETTADGYHVVLNGSKAMFAFATAKTDLSAVSFADTAGYAAGKKCDSHTGSPDSTAIGDWRTTKPVYIIDRGVNEMGQQVGWAKLQVLSVTDSSYQVRFASLDNTGEATTITVRKDSAYNLAFVSFTTNEQFLVEPPKHTWDLTFTQYTFIFYDQTPPVPYLVTGCLLNRYNTVAYLDTATSFADISYGNIKTGELTNDINTIGYDWKVYTSSGNYVVRAKNSYVIRDADGIYYKLHFTGFYSATGAKGSPQWEFQQL
ncbi:hypothetical protein GCM10023093_03730 [Nemorincola caseinilytica]|uniref:HmuY protein n=1 Tax=Nemorincola caseinilytica TaxID=2054315 RepID=A0ABP8N3I6_9BACT